MNWTIKEYNLWLKDGQPINLLVTTLNISKSNINSLNGIENLLNLTTLKYQSNLILHIPPNIVRILNRVKNGRLK